MDISLALWTLPFALLVAYFIVGKGVIPYLESRKPSNRLHAFGNEAAISVLTSFNSLLLLASLTYAAFAVTVVLAKLSAAAGGRSYVEFLIDTSSKWHERLGAWEGWEKATFLAAGVALAIVVYRRRSGYYRELFISELQQTEEDLRSGKQTPVDLPPTADMQAIDQQLAAYETQLGELRQQRFTAPGAQLNAVIEQREEATQKLRYVRYLYGVAQQMPAKPAPSRPATLREDVLTVLSSKGLFNAFSTAGGRLSKGIAVLWFLSLLSIQTHQATGYVSESVSQQVLDRELAQAREQFTAAAQQAQGHQAALTPEDEAYLDAFAADFEVEFANSLSGASSVAEQTDFQLRSTAVRAEILSRYVHARTAQGHDNAVALDSADAAPQAEEIEDADAQAAGTASSASPQTRQYVSFQHAFYRGWRSPSTAALQQARSQTASFGAVRKAPRTATGHAVREELRKVATDSRPLWEKMKANVKASMRAADFFEPVELKELSKLFVVDGVGEWAKGKVDFGHLEGIAKKLNPQVWEKLHEKIIYEHLNKLAGGDPYDQVLSSLRNRPPAQAFSSPKYARVASELVPQVPQAVLDELAVRPPSLKAPASKAESEAVVSLLDDLNGGRRTAGTLRPLNTFDDFFPGQLGSETRTTAGRALQSAIAKSASAEAATAKLATLGGEVVEGVGRAVMEASFSRARSYRALRGFSRVGGVLIGDVPQAGKTSRIPCIGLRWEAVGNQLELVLRQQNGKEIEVGRFDNDIVQQALAYAADVLGEPGKKAWRQFMARSVKPDYGLGPQFAIVPR